MSVQVKRRRDTAANIATFTPAQGEIIADTTNNRMILGDGATAGGWAAAKLSEVPCAPSAHGATATFLEVEMTPTLSGTSVVFTIPLPSHSCVLFGISARVTTAISGATSFEIGTTAGGFDIANGVGVTLGSTSNGAGPVGYYGGGNLYITPVGGAANFSAGAVRLVATILTMLPPTS